MLPPKVEKKLEKRIARLESWRYRKVCDVALEIADTMEHFRKPPAKLKYRKIEVGDTWGKGWRSAWFRGNARVPAECKGQRLFYRMVTWGEMLLFVNGKPFAGMDPKHHEVLLDAKAEVGKRYRLSVEAYSGHKIGSSVGLNPGLINHQTINTPSRPLPLPLESSELIVERKETAALHYDADVLFKTAQILDGNSLRKAQLLEGLNEAIDLIPFEWETEEELEAASRAARKRLAPLLKDRNGPATPHAGLVGHAHIDIAWLWPMRETIRKAARTFSSVINLMKDYPELTFIQSQPVLYDMIEKHYPELLPEIKKLVRSGKWEPNGGTWVEPDCNISGGEALVRQFLEGTKKTEELFGYTGDTLWLPDVFGYSAALPQILEQCGIKNFVTLKINWNDTNRFPYDTFTWAGIDGTEVFTHFLTCRAGGYNANVSPEVMWDCWEYVQQKEVQDGVLASVGYGDGGGGPTREMCERAKRMKDLAGCPKSTFVNASKFLEDMRNSTANRPRWVGELYLEHHRGTYTTQAHTKRYNRKLEILLREVEFYSTWAMQSGFKYPAEDLQRHWRTLLTNQFHDILPGSSISEVYADAEAEYAQMEKELKVLEKKVLRFLCAAVSDKGKAKNVFIGNSLSWKRSDVVVLENTKSGGASACDGTLLPAQQLTLDGKPALAVLVHADELGLSTLSLNKGASETPPSPFRHTGRTLATPFYKVKFDKAGKITSLIDRKPKREIVRKGRRLNEIYSAEDIPIHYDAWDIDLFYREKIEAEDRLISREVIADGTLFITLRSEYAIGRHSSLQQEMTFYAHSRRIDFKTTVDWNETHVLLKVGFPVDVNADSFRAEIQFGHTVRPTHANTSVDVAQFETCAHKWVDVSEGDYGVALLNDCKYGHDTLDNMISLTLLKSSTGPAPCADKGHHEFTYALLPHDGAFNVETVVREAYQLNVPLSVTSAPGRTMEAPSAFCRVSNPNVIVESIKKAEAGDSVIVRVYEAGNSRGNIELSFNAPIAAATTCNLLERDDKPVVFKDNTVRSRIRPFEIKTFKVKLSDSSKP